MRDADRGGDAVSALAAKIRAMAVTKPLVWDEGEQDRGDGTSDLTGDWSAQSAVGEYTTEISWGSDSYYWSVAINSEEIGHSFEDLIYAKAAAQADYNARIASAQAIDLRNLLAEATERLQTVQDYISDAANGWLLYRGKAEISKMAKDDLADLEATLALISRSTETAT